MNSNGRARRASMRCSSCVDDDAIRGDGHDVTVQRRYCSSPYTTFDAAMSFSGSIRCGAPRGCSTALAFGSSCISAPGATRVIQVHVGQEQVVDRRPRHAELDRARPADKAPKGVVPTSTNAARPACCDDSAPPRDPAGHTPRRRQ